MEDAEPVRVLGVGVGLFLLLLVWSCALALLLMVSRLGSPLSAAVLCLATLVTIILLVVPTEDRHVDSEADQTEKMVDGMVIWRVILLVILSITGLGGAVYTALHYGLHPVLPQPIRTAKIK